MGDLPVGQITQLPIGDFALETLIIQAWRGLTDVRCASIAIKFRIVPK